MAVSFRKEKISRAALDDLARMYSRPVSEDDTLMYTLSSGTRIPVSRLRLLAGTGSLELKYLLGQTYPFHAYYGKGETYFPVTELVLDQDKKPWSKNPKDGTALLMLAWNSGTVDMYKGGGKVPMICYTGKIPPVTHVEGRRIDEKTLDALNEVALTEENYVFITKHFKAFDKIGTKKQRLKVMDITDDLLGTNEVCRALERLAMEQTPE